MCSSLLKLNEPCSLLQIPVVHNVKGSPMNVKEGTYLKEEVFVYLYCTIFRIPSHRKKKISSREFPTWIYPTFSTKPQQHFLFELLPALLPGPIQSKSVFMCIKLFRWLLCRFQPLDSRFYACQHFQNQMCNSFKSLLLLAL